MCQSSGTTETCRMGQIGFVEILYMQVLYECVFEWGNEDIDCVVKCFNELGWFKSCFINTVHLKFKCFPGELLVFKNTDYVFSLLVWRKTQSATNKVVQGSFARCMDQFIVFPQNQKCIELTFTKQTNFFKNLCNINK